MYFNESNPYYEENLMIKEHLESDIGKTAICGLALFYVEYRLTYYKDKRHSSKEKMEEAIYLLYYTVSWNDNLRGEFCNLQDFKNRVYYAVRRNNWHSLACFIEELALEDGPTGTMPFTRLAEAVNILKVVLEEYYEIPVSDIVREVLRD